MKTLSALLFSIILLAAVPVQAEEAPPPSEKFYKYANDEAEYIVPLPEAPSVKTIWADMGPLPTFLEDPPKSGNLGEIASFRRMNELTEDVFDVRVISLKVTAAFLKSLTEEKIRAALENDMKRIVLENKTFTLSPDNNKNLKWATLTGFSVDRNNRPFYNATHYLTGKQSITIVKVQYSVENKDFGEYYKKMVDGISYIEP